MKLTWPRNSLGLALSVLGGVLALPPAQAHGQYDTAVPLKNTPDGSDLTGSDLHALERFSQSAIARVASLNAQTKNDHPTWADKQISDSTARTLMESAIAKIANQAKRTGGYEDKAKFSDVVSANGDYASNPAFDLQAAAYAILFDLNDSSLMIHAPDNSGDSSMVLRRRGDTVFVINEDIRLAVLKGITLLAKGAVSKTYRNGTLITPKSFSEIIFDPDSGIQKIQNALDHRTTDGLVGFGLQGIDEGLDPNDICIAVVVATGKSCFDEVPGMRGRQYVKLGPQDRDNDIHGKQVYDQFWAMLRVVYGEYYAKASTPKVVPVTEVVGGSGQYSVVPAAVDKTRSTGASSASTHSRTPTSVPSAARATGSAQHQKPVTPPPPQPAATPAGSPPPVPRAAANSTVTGAPPTPTCKLPKYDNKIAGNISLITVFRHPDGTPDVVSDQVYAIVTVKHITCEQAAKIIAKRPDLAPPQ